MSSLTTEDAIGYRAFIRQPSPRRRWVGPAAPRTSPQWRPFQGPLSPRSAAYALSVISALFRWLVEQRYVLANPFAGVRVKAGRGDRQPSTRAFTSHEWSLIRPIAERLEDHGWSTAAALRLQFVLDFTYSTGLRSNEVIKARLKHFTDDDRHNRWISVVGKGNKTGQVLVPPNARRALDTYLAARRISTSPMRWIGSNPLVASISGDAGPLSASRLWAVMKRFFEHAASQLDRVNSPLADKLRRASPHWMRHTHATHALGAGASLTTVRDNLRHASVSTTSIYLHTDAHRRAAELSAAFGPVIAKRPPKATEEGKAMPFKSQAQRRKFAELLVKGKISNQTFEEWNRETGTEKLPERVKPKPKKKAKSTRKTGAKRKTTERPKAASRARLHDDQAATSICRLPVPSEETRQ